MKNIYLVILVIIALAVFILGMAIFINEKGNPQTANPQVETTRLQNEGSPGETVVIPKVSSPATESATQP